jgi:hypothetical protein
MHFVFCAESIEAESTCFPPFLRSLGPCYPVQIQDYVLFQLRDAPGQQKLKSFQQVRGTPNMLQTAVRSCVRAFAVTRFALPLLHQCRYSRWPCRPAPSLEARQARWAARWDRLQLPAETPHRQLQHRHQAPSRARLQRLRQPLRLAHQPGGRPRQAEMPPRQWQALRRAAHLQQGHRQMRGSGMLKRATLACSRRSRLLPACAPSATCSSEHPHILRSHFLCCRRCPRWAGLQNCQPAYLAAACRGPPKSSRDDPAFVESFYKSSRLHFIGGCGGSPGRDRQLLVAACTAAGGCLHQASRASHAVAGASQALI